MSETIARYGYVFPQTVSDDPNYLRAGGLTKMEYTALKLLTALMAGSPVSPSIVIPHAFDVAAMFLAEAEKRAKPATEATLPRGFQDS